MIICNGMERTVNQIDRIAELLFSVSRTGPRMKQDGAEQSRVCGLYCTPYISLVEARRVQSRYRSVPHSVCIGLVYMLMLI
jgi:hypothetical protein